MGFSFIPKHLQRTRKEVEATHKSKNIIADMFYLSVDDELEYLIKSLVKLDEADLAIETYVLSDMEVYRIAGYLPYNYFDVDMKNLFRIFLARSERGLCKVLYDQWQNSYSNEECNDFLHILMKNDENFSKYIEEKHLGLEQLDNILQNQDIVFGFGTEVLKYPFSERKTLKEKFDFFGIHEDSKLYRNCENVFYTFCRKEDYLEANKMELLNIIKKYEVRNRPLLKAFLINFLSKLKLKQLARFRDLARYFNALAGDARNPKAEYKFLFSDMPEDLIEKYINWINRCKIEEYFGSDERSEFWKQYRFINVQRFAKSNAVIMEFPKYTAVEFLGQRMGPIYFYSKEYFEKILEGQFMLLENNPMRQYLLHQTHYENEDRIEHRGYWQENVDDYIIRHHVTRKVFE